MEPQGEGHRDDPVSHGEAEDLAYAESQPDVDGPHPGVEAEELEDVGEDGDHAHALEADAHLDGVVAAVGAGVVDGADLVVLVAKLRWSCRDGPIRAGNS